MISCSLRTLFEQNITVGLQFTFNELDLAFTTDPIATARSADENAGFNGDI